MPCGLHKSANNSLVEKHKIIDDQIILNLPVYLRKVIVQMFSQAPGPQNTLLTKIVRFLDTRDVSFESIHNLIDESTTAQLVPAFAFLAYSIGCRRTRTQTQFMSQ